MRPRPDAAENVRPSTCRTRTTAGFNEAAARCRGKHVLVPLSHVTPAGASMRPRPDAAENRAATTVVLPEGELQ